MNRRVIRLISVFLIALGLAYSAGPSLVFSSPDSPLTQPTTAPVDPWSGSAANKHVGLTMLPAGANIAVIPIEGEIYDFTLESLKRRVDRAVQGGASLIVLEVNSPGGYVTSALNICKEIKSCPKPTVAWINREAYSGGILISSGANEMIMSPASAIGDCAPIEAGMLHSLAPTERAKILSPLLAEFRDSAQRNSIDFALYHAMCVLGVEVYEVKNKTTSEVRYVNQSDYQVMVKGVDPESLRSAARLDTFGQRVVPSTQPNSILPMPSVEEAGGISPQAVDADRGQWTEVRQVHDGQMLLTLNQTEAVKLGIARGIVRDDAELAQFYHANSVVRIDESWSERLAEFLTKPWMRAILILILAASLIVEYIHPGIGVSIVGLVAFGLLVGTPFIIGLAEIWHLILILIGVGLILLEVFAFPTLGALLVGGVVLVLLGLVLMVIPTPGSGFGFPTLAMRDRFVEYSIWTLVGLFASVITAVFFSQQIRQSSFGKRMILHSPAPAGEDPASTGISGEEAIGSGRIKVGDTGAAATGLRPSGRAQIGDQVIDVVTEGGFIQTGQPVRVIEVAGNRIVVEAMG